MTTTVIYERGDGQSQLTASQQEELLTLLDAQKVKSIKNPAEIGLGEPIYKLILGFISVFQPDIDSHGDPLESGKFVPKAGVDKAVWAWINGAPDVNAGHGFFGDFIREYTKAQYIIRGGNPGDSTEVNKKEAEDRNQAASNNIAFNLAQDLLDHDGRLPGIVGLGAIDAGAAAGGVFRDMAPHPDGDYTPWAGTLLFPYLGVANFTKDLLLNNDAVDAVIDGVLTHVKHVTGTYDLISTIQASQIAGKLAGFSSFINLVDAIKSVAFGLDVIDDHQEDLIKLVDEYFWKSYGLTKSNGFDAGDDLPFDSFSSQFGEEFIAGSYIGESLSTTSGDDIVNAGLGNDTILGSNDSDLIDGADGIDTADYSLVSSYNYSLRFVTDMAAGALYDYRIELTKGSWTDYLYSIERLVFGTGDDKWVLDSADFTKLGGLEYIDFGGNSITGDTLDLSALTAGISITDAGDNGLSIQGADFYIKNIENFKGTNFADRIEAGSGNNTLIGGTGNDILNGGIGNDRYQFVTGDGFDIIKDAAGLDSLWINGVQYTSAKQMVQGADGWISEDEKVKFILSGNDLLALYGNNDSVLIENYKPGAFGLTFTQNNSFPFSDEGRASVISGTNQTDLFYDAGSRGTQNDKMLGFAGSDRLFGFAGDDLIYAYNDTSEGPLNPLINDRGITGDWLDGGAGDDKLVGSAGADGLFGGAGADTIVAGGGDDIIAADGISSNLMPDLFLSINTIAIGNDVQKVAYVSGLIKAPIGDENSGNDFVFAGAGNDWVDGYKGNDYIEGNAGNDYLYGSMGNDTLVGGDDNDTLVGDGFDALSEAMPASRVPGGLHGNDLLIGGQGNDLLYGNGGHDQLQGGDGEDTLYGDDRSTPGEFHGNDMLDGGDQNDTLLGMGGQDTLLGGGGDDVLDGDLLELDGRWHAADFLDGGTGNDTLYGQGGSDSLYGGAGDDYLQADNDALSAAYQGNDYLDGGADNDTLWGGAGADTLLGGSGADSLNGESGADNLNGQDGADTLWGGDGNDTLLGGSGEDYLSGDGGNNLLDGGSGNDALRAGAGNDRYVFTSGYGVDVIKDEGGQNNIQFGSGFSQISMTADVIQITSGETVLRLANGAGDALLIFDYQGWSQSTFSFSDGSELSFAQLMKQVITPVNASGTAQADALYGSNLNDTLVGGTGDDLLTGQGGADRLNGGAGNDTYLFETGDGADLISDREGDNVIRFGAGISKDSVVFKEAYALSGTHVLKVEYAGGSIAIFGGAFGAVSSFQFADGSSLSLAQAMSSFAGLHLTAENVDSHFYGSDSADTLTGGSGNDAIDAQAGDDLLRGGAGNDTLQGGAGSDQLWGDEGNDLLLGGLGDDTLVGGQGNDRLQGGSGSNTYLFGLGMQRDVLVVEGGAANVLRLSPETYIQDLSSHRAGDDLIIEYKYADDGICIKDFYTTPQTWQITSGVGVTQSMGDFLQTMVANSVSDIAFFERQFKQQILDDFATQANNDGFKLDGDGHYYRKNVSDDPHQFVEAVYVRSVNFIDGEVAANPYGVREVVADVVSAYANRSYTKNITVMDIDSSGTAEQQGGAYNDVVFIEEVGALGQVSYVRLDAASYFFLEYGSQLREVRDSSGFALGFWIYPPASSGSGSQGTQQVKTFSAYTYTDSTTYRVASGDDGGGKTNVAAGNIFYAGQGNDLIVTQEKAWWLSESSKALGVMLSGGAGNDTIFGNEGDDFLVGGFGDDTLLGGNSKDTYIVYSGDGDDVVADFIRPAIGGVFNDFIFTYEDGEGNRQDTLILPEKVSASQVSLEWGATQIRGVYVDGLNSQNGRPELNAVMLYTTLNISWGTGQRIQVVMPHANDPAGTGVEFFRFADGATLSLEQLLALGGLGSMPDPYLLGGVVSGDGKSDPVSGYSLLLAGGAGNDTLIGDGSLSGSYGDDSLVGGAFADVLNGGKGADTLIGGAGDDRLGGALEEYYSAANLYQGGAGNDEIFGTQNGDTYLFSRGDGQDTISDLHHLSYERYRYREFDVAYGGDAYARWAGMPDEQIPIYASFDDPQFLTVEPNYQDRDILKFGEGISVDDVYFDFQGSDLVILFANSDDSIRFSRWADFVDKPLKQIEFADGTVWGEDRIRQLSPLVDGYGGYGGEGTVLLCGGSGADRLIGYLANEQIRGGNGDDLLVGMAGNDQLYAEAGNDTLAGGSGQDQLYGGAGSDSYVFALGDGQDVIEESLTSALERNSLKFADSIVVSDIAIVREGTDLLFKHRNGVDQITVKGWFSSVRGQKLASIEFADGTRWDSVSAENMALGVLGSAGDDYLTGLNSYNDSLVGLEGNDELSGYSGDDELIGGAGDDTLNGGSGQDNMIGGTGNDTYVVDNVTDVVTELAGQGMDTVKSSISYSLTANTEKLILLGTAAINGTGNAENNSLYGNIAGNILTGWAGDDSLDGKTGADTLIGGIGSDTYVVDNAADWVVENAGEGTDTVKSSVSYSLGANVENLTLTGTADINASGNELGNSLKGNVAANILSGGLGNDSLQGGLGNDSYLFARGDGKDKITENDATVGNHDSLIFSGVNHDQLWFRSVGSNLEVSVIGTGDKVSISNWNLGASNHVEQILASDGLALSDAQVANLVNAMAAFAPPAAGQTSLSSDYHAALDSVIAANWQ